MRQTQDTTRRRSTRNILMAKTGSPQFTKRDYTTIARILRTAATTANGSQHTNALRTADLFARMFAADNQRFDRDRFLIASGVLSSSIGSTLRECLEHEAR